MRTHEKRPTRMGTLGSLKSVYLAGSGGGGWLTDPIGFFLSRLHFLDQTFVTKCAFFVLRGHCNTPAHWVIEYHNDGKVCLILGNLKF